MAVWQEYLHPRDWRGRFITKGTHVVVAGGMVGTVRGIRPGRLEGDPALVVVSLGDGRSSIVPSDRLTVAEPPRGGAYVGDGSAVYPGDVVWHSDGDAESVVVSINENGSITVNDGATDTEVDPGTLLAGESFERDTMLPPEDDGAFEPERGDEGTPIPSTPSVTPDEPDRQLQETIDEAYRASDRAEGSENSADHKEAADALEIAINYLTSTGTDPSAPEVRALRQRMDMHRDEQYNSELVPVENLATGSDGEPVRIGDWVEGEDGSGPVTDIVSTGGDTIVIYDSNGSLLGEDQSYVRRIDTPTEESLDPSEPLLTDTQQRLVNMANAAASVADEPGADDGNREIARDFLNTAANRLVTDGLSETDSRIVELRRRATAYDAAIGNNTAGLSPEQQAEIAALPQRSSRIMNDPDASLSDHEAIRDRLRAAARFLRSINGDRATVTDLNNRAAQHNDEMDQLTGVDTDIYYDDMPEPGTDENLGGEPEETYGADGEPIRVGDNVGYDSENPEGVVTSIRDGMVIYRDNDDDEELVGYPTDMYGLGPASPEINLPELSRSGLRSYNEAVKDSDAAIGTDDSNKHIRASESADRAVMLMTRDGTPATDPRVLEMKARAAHHRSGRNSDNPFVNPYATSTPETTDSNGAPTPTGNVYADGLAMSDYANDVQTNPKAHTDAINALTAAKNQATTEGQTADIQRRIVEHGDELNKIADGEYGAIDADGNTVTPGATVLFAGGDEAIGEVTAVDGNRVTVEDFEGFENEYKAEELSVQDKSTAFLPRKRDAEEFSEWGDERAEKIAASPGPQLSMLQEALRSGDRQKLKDAIHAAYNGPTGTVGTEGATVKFDRVTNSFNSVRFNGNIFSKEGRNIGRIERTFKYEDDQVFEVHNDYLSIDRDQQGQGIAAAIYENQENWFIRDGVEKVTILANIDVGGYAWARAGFDYDGSDEAVSHTGTLLNKAKRLYGEDHPVTLQLKAMRAQMADAMDLDDESGFPSPFEMSRIGYDDRRQDPDTGRMMWAGKELMLGTHWNAVRYLVPPTESSSNE